MAVHAPSLLRARGTWPGPMALPAGSTRELFASRPTTEVGNITGFNSCFLPLGDRVSCLEEEPVAGRVWTSSCRQRVRTLPGGRRETPVVLWQLDISGRREQIWWDSVSGEALNYLRPPRFSFLEGMLPRVLSETLAHQVWSLTS